MVSPSTSTCGIVTPLVWRLAAGLPTHRGARDETAPSGSGWESLSDALSRQLPPFAWQQERLREQTECRRPARSSSSSDMIPPRVVERPEYRLKPGGAEPMHSPDSRLGCQAAVAIGYRVCSTQQR